MDKTYEAPVLVEVGSVEELTLGNYGGHNKGGSKQDSSWTATS